MLSKGRFPDAQNHMPLSPQVPNYSQCTAKYGKVFLVSQILSILIACTSTSATLLSVSPVYAPAFLSSTTYLLLFLIYGVIVPAYERRWAIGQECSNPETSSSGWWRYLMLGFLDVEANYLVVVAFRMTSMTSVALLDQVSIPVVFLMTRILGLASYKSGHYWGVALCVVGLTILVSSDASNDSARVETNSLLGDGLVILGASLYGLANTLQELILVDVEWKHVLGRLGMWGFVISVVQGCTLELDKITSAAWTWPLFLYAVGFSVAMFAFYSLIPFVLDSGGATFLNISLLTSDLYVLLARLVIFGILGKDVVVFLASFALVAAGIVLYSMTGYAKISGQEDEVHGSLPYRQIQTGRRSLDTEIEISMTP